MSKLAEVFASVLSTLHWGPSLEPFHRTVIAEHDALEARVAALESRILKDEDATTPCVVEQMPGDSTAYNEVQEQPVPSAEDQNPAEPVQTPILIPLEASPEPVTAGPDDGETDDITIETIGLMSDLNIDPQASEDQPQDPLTE